MQFEQPLQQLFSLLYVQNSAHRAEIEIALRRCFLTAQDALASYGRPFRAICEESRYTGAICYWVDQVFTVDISGKTEESHRC